MIEEDLSVFFDADDFAVEVVRQRPAVPDLTFHAIIGSASEEGLQSYTVGMQTELRFATNDVKAEDLLSIGATTRFPATSWRVQRVDQVNDGSEMLAFLVAPFPGP